MKKGSSENPAAPSLTFPFFPKNQASVVAGGV